MRCGPASAVTLPDASCVYRAKHLLEDPSEAWHVCRSGWGAGRVDHMSCSLINAQLPTLFTYGLGMILSSHARFLCAYTAEYASPAITNIRSLQPCWLCSVSAHATHVEPIHILTSRPFDPATELWQWRYAE